VLLGDGAGGFSPAVNFPTGNAPTSIAVGDFNGDGYPDLAIVNHDSNTVTVLINNRVVSSQNWIGTVKTLR
jgi:hypothetical protein